MRSYVNLVLVSLLFSIFVDLVKPIANPFLRGLVARSTITATVAVISVLNPFLEDAEGEVARYEELRYKHLIHSNFVTSLLVH